MTLPGRPAPDEHEPDHSLRDLFVTTAGVLLVVAAVNGVLLVLSGVFPLNRTQGLIAAKWGLLRSTPPERRVDWLILGDSSGNQGLDPARIRATAGVESLNLCTVGACRALDDAWMLEAWLMTHDAPHTVVVVHAYDVWRREGPIPDSVLAYVPLSWDELAAQRPPLKLPVKTRAAVSAAAWIPLYAQNTSLSMLIREPRRFSRNRSHLTADGFDRQSRADPQRVRENAQEHLREIAQEAAILSDVNRAALERLAELTQAHGARLALVSAPTCEDLAQAPAFQNHVAKVTAALKAFAGEHDHVELLFDEPVVFPATDMENADHVVGDAARRYTDEVVRVLTRR